MFLVLFTLFLVQPLLVLLAEAVLLFEFFQVGLFLVLLALFLVQPLLVLFAEVFLRLVWGRFAGPFPGFGFILRWLAGHFGLVGGFHAAGPTGQEVGVHEGEIGTYGAVGAAVAFKIGFLAIIGVLIVFALLFAEAGGAAHGEAEDIAQIGGIVVQAKVLDVFGEFSDVEVLPEHLLDEVALGIEAEVEGDVRSEAPAHVGVRGENAGGHGLGAGMPAVNAVAALPVPAEGIGVVDGEAVVESGGKPAEAVIAEETEAHLVAGEAEVVVQGAAPGEGGVRGGGREAVSFFDAAAEGSAVEGVLEELGFGGGALAEAEIGGIDQ